jgi:hypothetical protein
MRHWRGTTIAAVLALLAFSAPAVAEAAAQQADDDWKVVIYPVYGWLPLHRATARLPEDAGSGGSGGSGGDGSVIAKGETDSSFDQAILAAFRIDKGRFSLEGGFLYAGLSGESSNPFAKINVDVSLAHLLAGYEVIPELFLEAGVDYVALDVQATIGDFPRKDWNPDVFQPVIGFTYRPMLSERWRLVLHADVGGVVTDNGTTATGTARLEWQPMKHLVLTAGGSATYLKTEGTIAGRDASLEQTLYGPVIGFGIPF